MSLRKLVPLAFGSENIVSLKHAKQRHNPEATNHVNALVRYGEFNDRIPDEIAPIRKLLRSGHLV